MTNADKAREQFNKMNNWALARFLVNYIFTTCAKCPINSTACYYSSCVTAIETWLKADAK